MNYIEQIKGFWIAQEAYQLGTSEIALYFYLLEVCNKTGWTGTFYRNNYKVMSDLSIKSYKTLQSVRDKLSNARVLVFVQKNGDANVSYTLLDLSKIYLGKGEGSGKGKGKGKGEGSGKVNINQTKPDQTSKSHSGDGAPEPEKKITPHWKELVEVWFQFYQTHYELKPTFKAEQAENLKRIVAALEKIAITAKEEWSEAIAKKYLLRFLYKARKDEWLQNNFLLKNLNSNFDAIVTPKNEGTTTNRSFSNAASRADDLRTGQDRAAEILREQLGELHDG